MKKFEYENAKVTVTFNETKCENPECPSHTQCEVTIKTADGELMTFEASAVEFD